VHHYLCQTCSDAVALTRLWKCSLVLPAEQDLGTYPILSTRSQSTLGVGMSGEPSYKTTDAPVARADTIQFHIIQPTCDKQGTWLKRGAGWGATGWLDLPAANSSHRKDPAIPRLHIKHQLNTSLETGQTWSTAALLVTRAQSHTGCTHTTGHTQPADHRAPRLHGASRASEVSHNAAKTGGLG
jgi:hypothetical protein